MAEHTSGKRSHFYAEAYQEARDSGLGPGNARLFAAHEEPLRFQAYLAELERLVELAEQEVRKVKQGRGDDSNIN